MRKFSFIIFTCLFLVSCTSLGSIYSYTAKDGQVAFLRPTTLKTLNKYPAEVSLDMTIPTDGFEVTASSIVNYTVTVPATESFRPEDASLTLKRGNHSWILSENSLLYVEAVGKGKKAIRLSTSLDKDASMKFLSSSDEAEIILTIKGKTIPLDTRSLSKKLLTFSQYLI